LPGCAERGEHRRSGKRQRGKTNDFGFHAFLERCFELMVSCAPPVRGPFSQFCSFSSCSIVLQGVFPNAI
jgi:hypothetical protein